MENDCNREKRLQRMRDYYANNKEKFAERSREYRKTDTYKKNRKEYSRRYREKHPDTIIELREKYNSRVDVKEKNKRHRERYRKLWENIIREMNMDKCVVCGYNKCFAAIDFHHVNGDKSFTISSKMRKLPSKEVINEIKKCIPLCANCHRELHNKEDCYGPSSSA